MEAFFFGAGLSVFMIGIGGMRYLYALTDAVEWETSRRNSQRGVPAIITAMADSAAQVDRMRPADHRDSEAWNGPGMEWWEAFVGTVESQLEEDE